MGLLVYQNAASFSCKSHVIVSPKERSHDKQDYAFFQEYPYFFPKKYRMESVMTDDSHLCMNLIASLESVVCDVKEG